MSLPVWQLEVQVLVRKQGQKDMEKAAIKLGV
jgi:hypothetical protein